MPAFSLTIPDLAGFGPVIEVTVSPPSSLNPSPTLAESIRMMVDTGASHTAIQAGLAQKLKLAPVGTTAVTTPSTQAVSCYQYAVRLEMPNSIVIDPVVVTEMALQGQHIVGLIGRDVLANAQLVYTGWTNTWTLAF